METNSRNKLEDSPNVGLGTAHIRTFIANLRTEGYAERTLRKKQSVVKSFIRWTGGKHFKLQDLNESHLTAYVGRVPDRKTDRANFEMSALKPFLTHLWAELGMSPSVSATDISPADDLKKRYTDYLLKERGLSKNSVLVYLPVISDFLNEQLVKTGFISPEAFNAQSIQCFLLDRVRDRSGDYAHLLATALRSFLRFAYLRQGTTIDLSFCVPTVRKWDQAKVPGFLSPDEVEHVLSAIDRSSPRGNRDYAILLLLARLGLRAGEIITLELGDILWRKGEIFIRGKGRTQDRLPLLSDIGEALAVYLTQYRGVSTSRRVFLRMLAPRIGLTGPAAVGHIVRFALARSGLSAPSRSAAHLFRHSLATKMIRNGASIAEISEILRHRSQNTTQIYAKVDFESLREVARSWPQGGGK
jgi:integrase/recombinase XerD